MNRSSFFYLKVMFLGMLIVQINHKYSQGNSILQSGINTDGAEYLIIVHDSLFEAVKPLAQWKREKGYLTSIIRLSEIGVNISYVPDPVYNAELRTYSAISDTLKTHFIYASAQRIRSFVMEAAQTWSTPPKYLLLVGDHQLLPSFQFRIQKSDLFSDHDYGVLTVPGVAARMEVFVGRLPATNLAECKVMVEKILAYEMGHVDPDIFEQTLLVTEFSNWENDGYEGGAATEVSFALKDWLGVKNIGSTLAIHRMPGSTKTPLFHWRPTYSEWDISWAGGDTVSGDILKGIWPTLLHPPGELYNPQPEIITCDSVFYHTVINTIEKGVGLINFSAHFTEYGMAFPRFSARDAANLKNSGRLPVITVFGCSAGSYRYRDNFIHAWLANPKGGAAGAIAVSSGTWANQSWYLNLAFYNGLEGDLFTTLAQVPGYLSIQAPRNPFSPGHQLGKLLAYAKYSLPFLMQPLLPLGLWSEMQLRSTQYHYNLLGDPEMELRLGKQDPLEVIYYLSKSAGKKIALEVKRAGLPLENARISLYQNGVTVASLTHPDGTGILVLPEGAAGKWLLTVTATDCLPFRENMSLRKGAVL